MDKNDKKRIISKLMKALAQKHYILFSVTIIVIALILDPVIDELFYLLALGEYIPKIMGQVIPGILFILMTRCILPDQKIGFTRKGFLAGIGLGWIFIVYSIYNLDFLFLSQNGIVIPPLAKVVGLVMFSIAIGFYEETLVRGLVLKLFLSKWGHTKIGIYKAVIIPNVIFGFAHLVNLFYSPELKIATLTQIVYATICGLFFSSIYLRTNNIWAVILLHALFDFAIYFKTVFSTAINKTTEITVINGIAIDIVFLPLALIGLFYLRKVVPMKKEGKLPELEYKSVSN